MEQIECEFALFEFLLCFFWFEFHFLFHLKSENNTLIFDMADVPPEHEFRIKTSVTHANATMSVTTWQSEVNCLNMEILWNYSFVLPTWFAHLRVTISFCDANGEKIEWKFDFRLSWCEHHVIFCAINQCRLDVMLLVISLFWLQWKSNVKKSHSSFRLLIFYDMRTDGHSFFHCRDTFFSHI